MHGPADAWSLWQAWRRVEEERAAVLAELHSLAPGDAVGVLWGRRRYLSAEAIHSASLPGWARLDPAALWRHRRTVERLVSELQHGHEHGRRAAVLEKLGRRAGELAQEARLLALRIRCAPVTSTADVLARLDVIAAMWGPAGEIAEPGAPLAEVLALMEALSRCAPGFVPTWIRRRTASGRLEH